MKQPHPESPNDDEQPKSYYYDDSTGYEMYDPDEDDDNDQDA
jgi:hypothetical protein